MINDLIAKTGYTVTFLPGITELETGFDPGMRARLKAVSDEGDDCLKLEFDFSEFEEFNKKFAAPNYFDENGTPRLRWFESSYYPKDCIQNIWLAANHGYGTLFVFDEGKPSPRETFEAVGAVLNLPDDIVDLLVEKHNDFEARTRLKEAVIKLFVTNDTISAHAITLRRALAEDLSPSAL